MTVTQRPRTPLLDATKYSRRERCYHCKALTKILAICCVSKEVPVSYRLNVALEDYSRLTELKRQLRQLCDVATRHLPTAARTRTGPDIRTEGSNRSAQRGTEMNDAVLPSGCVRSGSSSALLLSAALAAAPQSQLIPKTLEYDLVVRGVISIEGE